MTGLFQNFIRLNNGVAPSRESVEESLWVMLPIISLDVGQAFTSAALSQRSTAKNATHLLGSNDPLVNYDFMSPSRRMSVAINRPNKKRFDKILSRKLKYWAEHATRKAQIISSGLDHPSDVLTFQETALTRRYSSATGIFPIMGYPEDYLGRFRYSRVPRASGAELLMPVIRQLFFKEKVLLEPEYERWLSSSINIACDWATQQLTCARSRKATPKVFWSGTLGNPVYRVMSIILKERGCKIIGFDHGTSSGMFQTPVQAMLEFDLVDEFVTFSHPMAEGLKKNFQKSFQFQTKPPEFHYFCAQEKRKNSHNKRTVNNAHHLIYVPTMYSGEAVHIIPNYSDVQMKEWQKKLIQFLVSSGYNVSLKPHPECPIGISPAVLEEINGNVITGRFEDLNLCGETLLFDYVQTSALISALKSNHPIVLMHTQRLKMWPEARKVLESRCTFVDGMVSSEGSLQLDFSLLKKQIKRASKLVDASPVNKYFPCEDLDCAKCDLKTF